MTPKVKPPKTGKAQFVFLAPATQPYYSKDKFIEAKLNENKTKSYLADLDASLASLVAAFLIVCLWERVYLW